FAGFNGSWLPLRRKLSHPSAAYLHSRNSSVASANNLDVMRLGGQQQQPQQVPESGVSPRALARLVDTAQHQPRPRTLSGLSLATGLDFSNDYAQDQLAEYGQLKTSAEAAAASVAGGSGPLAALRPFRPAHRRLMSDSQFSAVSDASSFGDTQGHVEVPDAFGQPSREEEEWTRAKALEALHQFSTEGLRTLAYAHKEISESAYESWHQRYMVATTALVNRQQQVEAACEEIEGDLLLSGVSAIEDRLQAGVPETIFKLRRAGIRVWMLTGDKVETAINIAKSCRLIDTDVVETTKVDERTELGDRMTLLVMQSMTDLGELDRILSQALATARAMTATVDERFESRSRMEKLRRGMKRFGGFFVPSRVRSRADACMEEPLLSEDNNSRLSKSPAIAAEVGHHRHLDQNAIQHQGHGQGQQPIAGGGGAAAAAAAVSEVGWADDVQRGATPTTLLGLAKDSRAKRTLSISTD
ncbi:drs2 neo1 protein, partial [Kickxella alabastrina]